MTFSGQVAWHSPHCTQASSAKRSSGRSGSSVSAPVGQADTQARHSVQPATFTSHRAEGRAARAAARHRRLPVPPGAARAARSAARRVWRPVGRKSAGRGAARHRGIARSAAAQHVGIVGLDGRDPIGAEPRPRRTGSASAMVCANPAMSCLGRARSRKRTAEAP